MDICWICDIFTTTTLCEQGYHVKEMWECQWYVKWRAYEIKDFLSWLPNVKTRKGLTQKLIIDGILKAEFFGVLLCDIEAPAELKETFKEFCPIFKNVEVSRDDIVPFMKKFAEEAGVLQQPSRMLIGNYFGKISFWLQP